MTKTMAAKLCAVLAAKPHGNAAPWDKEIREGYLLLLQDIPEEVAQFLLPAVLRGTKFRETPGELMEMAEGIQHGQTPGAADAMEDAFAKRRCLGARAVQDGWLTPRCWDYLHPEGPRLVQCGPPIPNMVEGEPAFAHPLTRRVVGIMGGWTAFCEVPSAQEHFLRREFERLYHALHGGAQGQMLARLHQQYLEQYREAKAALPASSLSAPQEIMTQETDGEQGMPPLISRGEATEIMARIGAYLPHGVTVPLEHRDRSAIPIGRGFAATGPDDNRE